MFDFLNEINLHKEYEDLIQKSLTSGYMYLERHFSMDKEIKRTLMEILHNGTYDENPRPKYVDGTPAYTKFITHVFNTYDISKGEFPITTLRPIPWKSAIKEILWIYQDQSNNLELLRTKYNIHWWDAWESKDMPGTIGKRYGATIKEYNQLNKLIEGIKKDPYGRRHIMNMYQLKDFEETDGLIPCAYETIWTVRENLYLDVFLNQRSSDYMVAGSTSNPIQYTALLMMVAKATGLLPGKFSHMQVNCQIYDRHIQYALEMVKRTPNLDCIPKLIFKSDSTDFYSYTIDDFELDDWKTDYENFDFELAI